MICFLTFQKCCTNFYLIFTKLRKFRSNFDFVKFKENFAKHETKSFAKISRNYENENFRSHPRVNGIVLFKKGLPDQLFYIDLRKHTIVQIIIIIYGSYSN